MKTIWKILLLAALVLPSPALAQSPTRPSIGSMVVTPCSTNALMIGGGNGSPAGCASSNTIPNITVTGALKGNGSGAISQAACADLTNSSVYCSALLGQLPGTTTNDNPSAGNIGQIVISGAALQQSAAVTITIASPAVISWTGNPFYTRLGDGATPIPACASVVTFTNSGGALPTGITSGTPYYVLCGASLTANSFEIATSTANAIAGTAVNTSGSQSGTQTGTASATVTNGGQVDFGALSLSAGDWQVSGTFSVVPQSSTSITQIIATIGTTSGSVSGANAYTLTHHSNAAEVPGANAVILSISPMRVSLSSTTTVFCTSEIAFTVTTNVATSGWCQAIRTR